MAMTSKRGAAHAKTAAGGPGTHLGTNYQADFAVLSTLRLMRRTLAAGGPDLYITLEPRLVASEAITAWDIRTGSPGHCFEAKSNLTGADVVQWLKLVAVAACSNLEEQFTLAYGDGRAMLLGSLDHLVRDAREATDSDQFLRLADEISLSGASTILDALAPNAYQVLRRVALRHLPDAALQELISVESQQLAGPQRAQDLRNLLFEKLSRNASRRLTCRIPELIAEVQRDLGIALTLPQLDRLAELSEGSKAILTALQVCADHRLPAQVLLEAVPGAESDLRGLVSSGRIRSVSDSFELGMPSIAFPIAGMEEAIAAALESILSYIKRHGRGSAASSQLSNAIALARSCDRTHPKLVSSLFPRLDKFLKDRGDKHLVLEAADLSIGAARRVTLRDEEVARNEAKTLICGRSWVFQRVGRLDEAEVSGAKSLRLGDAIPWPRNTAYCKKCIGRLFRLQAEGATRSTREQLLDKSVEYLKDAINRFESLGESDSNDEKGDSLSLLGRTYLTLGRLDLARRAVREARRLIRDDGSKDDLDLKILMGDIERVSGSPSESFYSDALGSSEVGAEFSEIRARAYFSRAKARLAVGNMTGAKADFHRSFEIYNGLDEPEFAAQARWEELMLSEALPKNASRVLSAESYRVRVSVVERFLTDTATSKKRAIARRADPPDAYWARLAEEARRQVAISSVEW